MSDGYFLAACGERADRLEVRLDGLRQDIFGEIGRLTHHLENYQMEASTVRCFAAQVELLRELLRGDDERA